MAELAGIAQATQGIGELKKAGASLPAIAAAIRTSCRSQKHFAELVRTALYADFHKEVRTLGIHRKDKLVAFVQKKNTTLCAVAALCADAQQRGRYRKNPLVHGILNFNCDAVLRAYISARYGSPLLVRTVERASKSSDLAKINVYHMHGFLRFDSRAGMGDKEASDNLVLTEHEYFDLFNNPLNFFTYTFLYLLREHSCLFIGSSMIDDNIRRLLHYSAKERARGYMDEGKPFDWDTKVVRHFAILERRDSEAVSDAKERTLATLGVRVLWVSSFREIPDRLGEMYESAGGDWSQVY